MLYLCVADNMIGLLIFVTTMCKNVQDYNKTVTLLCYIVSINLLFREHQMALCAQNLVSNRLNLQWLEK